MHDYGNMPRLTESQIQALKALQNAAVLLVRLTTNDAREDVRVVAKKYEEAVALGISEKRAIQALKAGFSIDKQENPRLPYRRK